MKTSIIVTSQYYTSQRYDIICDVYFLCLLYEKNKMKPVQSQKITQKIWPVGNSESCAKDKLTAHCYFGREPVHSTMVSWTVGLLLTLGFVGQSCGKALEGDSVGPSAALSRLIQDSLCPGENNKFSYKM